MNFDTVPTSKSTPENRRVERESTQLKTIVQVKENDTETWKEVTRVTTVSRNGAGFSLARPVVVGRLVTLVMPLDKELRAYDVDNEVYPVMGLVQYCNAGMIDGASVFHVGVGFIGKQIPPSFKANPTQSYRISGMGKDGLWTITEAASQFKDRRHPRYWISLEVTLTLLQKEKKDTNRDGNKETTVTQNIAASGVSVRSDLDAQAGDKVKFACKSLDFYSIAVVRNRKVKDGKETTLHLEFIDNAFPVEKIMLALTEEPAENKEDTNFARVGDH